MQGDEFNDANFANEVKRFNKFHMGRIYHAQYTLDGENVRLAARVERYTFSDHAPLAGEPAAAVAVRLLKNIIRDNHNRLFPHDEDDLRELEATLAELDRV